MRVIETAGELGGRSKPGGGKRPDALVSIKSHGRRGWKSHLYGPASAVLLTTDHKHMVVRALEFWVSSVSGFACLVIVEVSLQIVAGQQTSNFQQAMQSAVPTAAELIHRAQKGGITRRSCTESDTFRASSKAICNDKQSKGFLLVTEVFGTMENYTTISPVATKEKYMYMISEDPIQRDLREKWCFHAHLNSRGMEWNGMGKVGTLGTYIYLHNGDGDDDAWTMVHLQKNILPTFFLSFLTKITTMHYLPAW